MGGVSPHHFPCVWGRQGAVWTTTRWTISGTTYKNHSFWTSGPNQARFRIGPIPRRSRDRFHVDDERCGSHVVKYITLRYVIVLPGRKSVFRADFGRIIIGKASKSVLWVLGCAFLADARDASILGRTYGRVLYFGFGALKAVLVDLCSIFQAGAVRNGPGSNFGWKPAPNPPKLKSISQFPGVIPSQYSVVPECTRAVPWLWAEAGPGIPGSLV